MTRPFEAIKSVASAIHRPAHAHRPPARLLPNTRSPADIAAHTLASARGAAAVARHAAQHVSNASMRALYDGAELRPFDQRAQLAEAQRDSERLDLMIEQRAYVVSDPDCCDGYWLNYLRPDGTVWTQATEHETPRAAIDAAMGERNA